MLELARSVAMIELASRVSGTRPEIVFPPRLVLTHVAFGLNFTEVIVSADVRRKDASGVVNVLPGVNGMTETGAATSLR